MRKAFSAVFVVFALLLAATVVASGHGVAADASKPDDVVGTSAVLPPVPAGLPNHFGFGLFNLSTTDLPAGVQMDYRYQYLCCGANSGSGWSTWNSPAGEYAAIYLRDTRALGLIPVFIYYNILQSAPSYSEFANFQNSSTMHSYYDDFKLLMQKAHADGGTIVVDVEPDLTGVMQEHYTNTNDDAALQPVSVASSGQTDVAGQPNTFRGFYQALAHIRDLYAPNVLLGIDISDWGATDDVNLALHANPSYDWQHHATRTATYLKSLGPGYQLLFYSPSDRDSAYYQAVRGQNRWWDDTNTQEPKFSTMMAWLGSIMAQMNKRMLWWQTPEGNRVYRSENNSANHWQDNRTEYFLNATSGRQHIADFANTGLMGIMYGAGQGDQTHYFDAKGDGITNPAAINGNNTVSTYADDDGGYIRLGLKAYYAGGAITLPTGATPTITRTPTRTATRTITKTPTITLTRTKTKTPTITPTRTRTPITSPTRTASRTTTRTSTRTPTITATRTRTAITSRTPTRTATRTAAATPTAKRSNIYSDALVNGWQNWSWNSDVNLTDATYKQAGSYAAGCTLQQPWAGLFFGHNGYNTTGYNYLKFYINGGSASGQNLQVGAMDAASGNFGRKPALNGYISGGGVTANTWRAVSVPLSDLDATNKMISGIVLQDLSGNAQPRFYVDSMILSSAP